MYYFVFSHVIVKHYFFEILILFLLIKNHINNVNIFNDDFFLFFGLNYNYEIEKE